VSGHEILAFGLASDSLTRFSTLGSQNSRCSVSGSLLFALPGFRVLDVSVGPDGARLVLVEDVATEGGCPSCGVASSLVKDRPVCRVKDLPHGVVALRVSVRKRRFVCAERLCSRGSFTQVSDQLPARARLTARLRVKVAAAVVTTNRAMSEVGAEFDLAWATVHRILVAAAVELLAPPELTTMIGIDETRTRRAGWVLADTVWRRSDPWMTSIVDLDPTRPGGIIGWHRGAPGRAWWPGWRCRPRSSGTASPRWRSTRPPRMRPGSAGPSRTR